VHRLDAAVWAETQLRSDLLVGPRPGVMPGSMVFLAVAVLSLRSVAPLDMEDIPSTCEQKADYGQIA
jgi:hypothetical protein